MGTDNKYNPDDCCKYCTATEREDCENTSPCSEYLNEKAKADAWEDGYKVGLDDSSKVSVHQRSKSRKPIDDIVNEWWDDDWEAIEENPQADLIKELLKRTLEKGIREGLRVQKEDLDTICYSLIHMEQLARTKMNLLGDTMTDQQVLNLIAVNAKECVEYIHKYLIEKDEN